jgi:FtsP/CotA-like multicopper oxidase with cupredoxin domain
MIPDLNVLRGSAKELKEAQVKITRRNFLTASGIGGAALLAGWRFGPRSLAAAQTPLVGTAIPKFIDPLPLLSVAGGPMETIIAGSTEIPLTMKEFQANVMPSTFTPATGPYTGTWVWGYRAGIEPDSPAGTFIGPAIVATRGTPTQVKFINNLTAQYIAWRDWTDQTLHWADPLNNGANVCAHSIVSGQPPAGDCAEHYMGPLPAVPHLHGAETPPVIDGGPDAWFVNDGTTNGFAYYTKPAGGAATNEAIYRYLNTQEAAPLWFHDHVLGATRIGVYAGQAGAYVLIDPAASLPTGLHPVGLQQGNDARTVEYLIPLVVQDRMFDTNGQLFFPNTGINPEHPFWIPEFIGDTIVVNGKVWPFLDVQAKRYRFLFINGSNARSYAFFLVNQDNDATGPPIWQISTDGGYLDAPIRIGAGANGLDKLVLMPGERAGVIIDFAGFQGQTLLMRNNARAPYVKGVPPHGSTLGQTIQFRVAPGAVSDASYDPASGTPLRTPMIRLINPAHGTLAAGVTVQKTRQLTLNEVEGPPSMGFPGGPLEILVNNTKWDGFQEPGRVVRSDFTAVTINNVTEYYSELPNEGDTEIWEIVNLTADAHPIHTHLTQFQLLNRQNFHLKMYNVVYASAFPGGDYIPAYGPPLNYATGNARALGGNPDVTPYLLGHAMPPDANEAGWKDTIHALPRQVTRIVVRYAPTDKPINDPELYYPFDPNASGYGFVWHCHIVDHEDNEMMRPYKVNPKEGATRTYTQGVDY